MALRTIAYLREDTSHGIHSLVLSFDIEDTTTGKPASGYDMSFEQKVTTELVLRGWPSDFSPGLAGFDEAVFRGHDAAAHRLAIAARVAGKIDRALARRWSELGRSPLITLLAALSYLKCQEVRHYAEGVRAFTTIPRSAFAAKLPSILDAYVARLSRWKKEAA